MALYIPHSIFHLARLLYIRPETFGPYYVCLSLRSVCVCVCVFFLQSLIFVATKLLNVVCWRNFKKPLRLGSYVVVCCCEESIKIWNSHPMLDYQ